MEYNVFEKQKKKISKLLNKLYSIQPHLQVLGKVEESQQIYNSFTYEVIQANTRLLTREGFTLSSDDMKYFNSMWSYLKEHYPNL